MEVFIDDDKLEGIEFEQGTLGDAVRSLQSKCCEPGRLIVSIRCDGLELSEQEMEEALEGPVAKIDRMDLYTGTAEGVVRDVMTQAHRALEETGRDRSRIVGLLTQGSIREGVESLAGVLGVWQQVHQAVAQSMEMLGVDPDTVEIKGKPLAEVVTEPRGVLEQVKQSLELQDYVLLADLLQYEFDDVTDQWEAIVDRLLKLADERDPAST